MTSLPVTGSIPVVRGALVAVVVTRGITPWLPETLTALAAQTRAPTRVLVVDAAPRNGAGVGVLAPNDPVARLARRTLDDVAPLWTVGVPGAATFGAAVREALRVPGVAAAPSGSAAGSSADWLWLLHDDCAPEPTALAELVRAVEHAPSVGVAGVKQRSWDDPARLLEVGLTTSRLGRRMTGVEDGEVDQGQHDGREDVLGVGLTGALVRRDVWDELDGPDPALGPFGDGLDLSRRARLAGHRVVVVPRAVVRHAQASYAGLRDDDLLHVLTGASAHDHEHRHDRHPRPPQPARTADPRRSFAARRRAHVHAHLAAVPLPLLPLQTVLFLVTGVVRSLVRIATKDGVLAAAELAAPVVAVLNPARMADSRAAARRARRLPRRSLRALQTTWRDVYREERDRALARVEARRVVQAPSELEIAELAALATRRRAGFAALVVLLVAGTVAVLGPLLRSTLAGERLVGGGLLPLGADAADLWHAVTAGWVPLGLGVAAPADPLLAVLLPVAAVTGSGQTAVHVLYLGGLVLAGLGAWSAAGAATRSVALRWWSAVVWVAAPSLLLALDDGRLGAVVAHAALPWAALGVARALGVQRTDVVVPGLVDARTGAAGAHGHAGGPTPDEPSPDPDLPEGADLATPDRGDHRAPDGAEPAPVVAGATAMVLAAPTPAGVPVPHVLSAAPVGSAAQGSATAAAAAGLAFAAAVAGAPLLLPAGLLALLGVAVAARRGRRRLLLVALPALALAGPLVVDAVAHADAGGWRALLAEPGLPVASTPGPAWQALLAWPTTPGADLSAFVVEDVAAVLPFVLGGTVLALALLALLRGPAVARGVRTGWLVAACGLGAAVVAARVGVAVVDGAVVPGWVGPGVSLALLGLLAAAALGADGTRTRMDRRTFGWRQIVTVTVTAVAVLAPAIAVTEWVVRQGLPAYEAGAPRVRAVGEPVVPAVGRQAQDSADRSRVLALGVGSDGEVRHALLRGDGPQATERSAAAAARTLTGGVAPGDAAGAAGAPSGTTAAPAPPPADAATAELEELVARLATGAAGDLSDDLGALAVGAVLVPPTPDAGAEAARSALVGRLDSTGGLERITDNPSGVIWRVVAPAAAQGEPDGATRDPGTPVTAWSRVVAPGPDGPSVTPLAAGPLTVGTTVPAGEAGRTVVLAERADDGWRAWLDGRPLPAVADGWRQSFALDEDGGRLTVAYAPTSRTVWGVVQAVVLGLTLLLALPIRRRRGGQR